MGALCQPLRMIILKYIWYYFVWTYLRVGLSFYFSKIKVSGLSKIPKGKPVIFAANHENAFLDALLLTTRIPRFTHYLVRADVFNNPIAKAALNSLNLMPVYRMRDGISSIKGNDEVFKNCYNVLGKGDSLLLFPEASHDMRRIERRITKGVARIALGALNAKDGPEELYVVPVGLNYSAHTKFRSTAHVFYGDPIKIEKQPEEQEYIEPLRKQVNEAMSECHVSLLRDKFDLLDEIFFHDVKKRKVLEPESINQAADRLNLEKLEELEEKFKTTSDELKSQGLHFPFEYRKSLLLDLCLMLFKLPFAVFGLLAHLPIILIDLLNIKLVIEDKTFISSMKFAIGMIGYVAIWVIAWNVALGYTGSYVQALIFTLLFPICLIALDSFTTDVQTFAMNWKLRSSKSLKEKYFSFVELVNQARS